MAGLKLTLTTSEGVLLSEWDLDDHSVGGKVMIDDEITEQANVTSDYVPIGGSYGWFVKPKFIK